MHIGQLASSTGLSADAIRFYERRGLLEKPPRTPGGFRIYRPSDRDDLAFVQACQKLGFSLDEVRELLAMRRSGGHACAQVRVRLENKLAVIRAKIRELAALEHELQKSLAGCRRALRRKASPAGPCPVLAKPCGPRRRSS